MQWNEQTKNISVDFRAAIERFLDSRSGEKNFPTTKSSLSIDIVEANVCVRQTSSASRKFPIGTLLSHAFHSMACSHDSNLYCFIITGRDIGD